MEHHGSLQSSQQPATGLCSELQEAIPHLPTFIPSRSSLILSSLLHLGSGWGMKLTTHLSLLTSFRMRGAIPPLPR